MTENIARLLMGDCTEHVSDKMFCWRDIFSLHLGLRQFD
jgi:hypothetical protein